MNPSVFEKMNILDPQADTVEKRRKQIEKAKAAHLSRQLQTRLQYARLKVDHGWQKQTLNEVENLYFHHYRARIPPRRQKSERNVRSAPSVIPIPDHSPVTGLASTSSLNSNDEHEQSQQSPVGAPSTNTVDNCDRMEVDSPAATPTVITSNEPTDATLTVAQPQPLEDRPFTPTVPSATTHASPFPQPVIIAKKPSLPGPPAQNHSIQHSITPIALTPTPSFMGSSASASRNTTFSHPSLRSQGSSRGPSPSTRPSPSTMSTSLPGSSNVALTYDSFWSSHTSTSNNYRTALANVAPFPGLTKKDAMSLPGFGNTYHPFTLSAPNAPFQPLPLPKRPSVAPKRSVPAAAAAGTVGHGLGSVKGGG